MNKNLFSSFINPTIIGLPIVILIVIFPTLLFPSTNWLVSNRLVAIQQWLLSLTSKQMIAIHNSKGQAWTLILISLILFIGSTNLLGLLPHSFTPTTQLSINLGMAIPLWAGTVVLGFCHKTKASLAHFLPQGTPLPLIPILVVIETISLFIQPITLAVRLTANYDSRTLANPLNWRGHISINEYQHSHSLYYVYYFSPLDYSRVRSGLNPSLRIHPAG